LPLVFGSPEWTEKYKKRVNSDEKYLAVAKGYTTTMLMIVRDVPFATYTRYEDGKIVEQAGVPTGEIEEYKKKSEFSLDFPTYDLFISYLQGKEDITKLVMSGRVKLGGPIPKIMRYNAATTRLGEIVKEFMKETTIPTKKEVQAALKELGLL